MFAQAITAHEPEHRKLLRAGARDFLDKTRQLAAVRALREEAGFDRASHARLGEMGWLGMMFASDGELGPADLAALHRELGRKVLPEPVIASGVLAAAVLAGADAPQHAGRLDAIVSGTSVATLAWQAAAGALGAQDCGISATAQGEGWRLNGTARFVPWADRADGLIVAARAGAGVLLGWLDPGASGLSLHPAIGIDRSASPDLHCDNVVLTAEAVIVDPDRGADLLDRALDLGRLAISAELVGAAEAAFALTLDYLRERKQFGRPIGANQALQFAATDLFVQIELANSVLSNAAQRFDTDPDRTRLIAGCKSRCSDVAFQTVRQAIQMHGAIGYTHECDVSLYVKRVMQWGAWLGNGAAQRKRLQALALAARAAA